MHLKAGRKDQERTARGTEMFFTTLPVWFNLTSSFMTQIENCLSTRNDSGEVPVEETRECFQSPNERPGSN